QANLARLSANGATRDYFHPKVSGNRVEEFLLLPGGDLLARGSITNIDGVDVGSVFKLHMTEPLAPLVQITLPTNGKTIRISDAIGLMDSRVEAFDPDGFLENTVVYMDDQAITTNTLSAIYVAQYPPLVAGEHKLRAVTTDATGLSSTNEIQFSVEFIPWPFGA